MTSEHEMPIEEYLSRVALVARSFSPAAPITDREVFAGRRDQMSRVLAVINQASQHALIYGERGVGKTSLARVMERMVDADGWGTWYHICSSADTFPSVWRAIFDEIGLVSVRPRLGFGSTTEQVVTPAGELLGPDVTPHAVARGLAALSAADRWMFVIDEFDRPVDPEVRTLLADTIKILADKTIQAKLVLVGVADGVDDLIAEHESIKRALTQIPMPRMTNDELAQIIGRGMTAAEMMVESAFVAEVLDLSQGLPHYAHLIGLHGAQFALTQGRVRVVRSDFEPALRESMKDVEQTVRDAFYRATFSNRETLYGDVLLACARARKDELGLFGATDVRDQLRRITGKLYDIPAFASHLNDFSSDTHSRGGILRRRGTTRRFRYRFRDPLMPSYVVMKSRERDDAVELIGT